MQLSVKQKVLISVGIIVTSLSVILVLLAIYFSSDALQKARVSQLQTTLVSKKHEIESYFKDTESLLVSLSNQKGTRDAMSQMFGAFKTYPQEIDFEVDESQKRLLEHMKDEYLSKVDYGIKNAPQKRQLSEYLPRSEFGVLLQMSYIVDNKHPIGQKNKQTITGHL